jgi:hypothetical protein
MALHEGSLKVIGFPDQKHHYPNPRSVQLAADAIELITELSSVTIRVEVEGENIPAQTIRALFAKEG